MSVKITNGVATLINDSEENDDWMKSLPGYRKGEQRAHKLAKRVNKINKAKRVVLDEDATTKLG